MSIHDYQKITCGCCTGRARAKSEMRNPYDVERIDQCICTMHQDTPNGKPVKKCSVHGTGIQMEILVRGNRDASKRIFRKFNSKESRYEYTNGASIRMVPAPISQDVSRHAYILTRPGLPEMESFNFNSLENVAVGSQAVRHDS